MDLEQFKKQTLQELQFIQDDQKLNFLKSKIASISNPNDRQLAEIMLEIGLTVGSFVPSAPPKIVVALIHGIRTNASWQELIRSELSKYDSITTYPIGYDYFDAFSFWFPFFTRKIPIERVLRELRGIQAQHRNDKFCVIAHSFGSYIISKILLEHSDVQLDRILLCGSVIPEKFRWDKVPHFPPNGILNDCGSKDVWPVFAKFASWGYGASGTFGFKTHKVFDRFHNLGHSDYFEIEFFEKFWLPFVREASVEKSSWDAKRPTPPLWLSLLSGLPVKTILFFVFLFYYVDWLHLKTFVLHTF